MDSVLIRRTSLYSLKQIEHNSNTPEWNQYMYV